MKLLTMKSPTALLLVLIYVLMCAGTTVDAQGRPGHGGARDNPQDLASACEVAGGTCVAAPFSCPPGTKATQPSSVAPGAVVGVLAPLQRDLASAKCPMGKTCCEALAPGQHGPDGTSTSTTAAPCKYVWPMTGYVTRAVVASTPHNGIDIADGNHHSNGKYLC